MIVIDNVTGATAYRNQKIQSRVAKLKFTIASATNAYDVILTNCLLTITKVGKNGERTLMHRLPLIVAAEYYAFGEGFIRNVLVSSTTTVQLTLDLADEGALDCNTDEYISLDIEGLLAADTLSVHAIDVHTTDEMYNYIDAIVCTGTTKNIPLVSAEDGEAKSVIIPLSTSGVESVQIEFKNGKSVKWVNAELKAICDDTNDLLYAGTSMVYGGNAFARIDLKDAVRMEIITNISTAFNVYKVHERKFAA